MGNTHIQNNKPSSTSAFPPETAYLIVRTDNKGNVYAYGIYSTTLLAVSGSDRVRGRDFVLASATGASYHEAQQKLRAQLIAKLSCHNEIAM